jgi:hypothetical protein
VEDSLRVEVKGSVAKKRIKSKIKIVLSGEE